MRLLLAFIFIFIAGNSFTQNSNQWQQRADFGNFGRHRATGMGIGNKAYVGTGHLNGTGWDTWYSDWWEYDPASNSWTQKADYPGNGGTGDQDIVSLPMDTVGYAGLGQWDGLSFYKYSPATNQWTQVSSAPSNGDFNNTFPFRIGSYGYFPSLGGSNFFRYDAINDTWLQLAPLPITTFYGTPTFAIGDRGYIKDPYNGSSFYEYNPSSDSWTMKAPFPGDHPFRPRGFTQYGYGFFIGGFQGNPGSLPWEWDKQVWRYDPLTDSWERQDDHPGTIRRWAVAPMIGNKVYYGLGTNGTNFNDWWQFDAFAGFDEEELDFDLNIYPNPATNFIQFKSFDLLNYSVQIIDNSGSIVLNGETNNGLLKLEREYLSAGSYRYVILVDRKLIKSGQLIFQ